MATFTSMAAPSAAVHSGEPAPPPPTPSNRIVADEASSASISRFLQNLHLVSPTTPQLSLPSRLSRCVASSPSVLISLLNPQSDLLLSAATNQGLFHLADHGVPAGLAASAVSEAYPLLSSSPTLADLGFGEDEEGDDDLVFDVLSERLGAIPAVAELAKSMEKVGVKVVEILAASGGLVEDPFRTGKLRARCLIWVSSNKSAGDEGEEAEDSWEMMRGRKRYPYVVGLQYEMKGRGPWWVLDDSGEWKGVATRTDSLLVTLGDIAQVWSNGKFNKVRAVQHQHRNSSKHVSITLFVTLTMDSFVRPLHMLLESDGSNEEANGEYCDKEGQCKLKFQTFAFKDYAWRVYNDRFLFKDPLLRYRIE